MAHEQKTTAPSTGQFPGVPVWLAYQLLDRVGA